MSLTVFRQTVKPCVKDVIFLMCMDQRILVIGSQGRRRKRRRRKSSGKTLGLNDSIFLISRNIGGVIALPVPRAL